VNHKHRVVISSYNDLKKIQRAKSIHFRKFLSKKLLLKVLEIEPNLREISLSNYAFKRLSKKCLEVLSSYNIIIKVSYSVGRPSLLELKRNKSMKIISDSYGENNLS
jgi:hypothetical protein